jgi:Ni/Co efflux regulator RcnB
MSSIKLAALVALTIAVSGGPSSAMPIAPISSAEAISTAVQAKVEKRRVIRKNAERRRHYDRRGHHFTPRRHYRGPRYHYRHQPRGWRRYHYRPRNWRARGCIVIGPIWFCP